ncbi:hypothetical protein KQX54_003552 [Cotesia glomerata]|uniref:Uncharacterized protein n=1 Tax=Cotesia glomerata TaxID=32391 RepID=A0AAV7IPE8_COTGL|nr:hypothetical protein KQX54_003552 [Cotesia glomerata]
MIHNEVRASPRVGRVSSSVGRQEASGEAPPTSGELEERIGAPLHWASDVGGVDWFEGSHYGARGGAFGGTPTPTISGMWKDTRTHAFIEDEDFSEKLGNPKLAPFIVNDSLGRLKLFRYMFYGVRCFREPSDEFYPEAREDQEPVVR